MLVIEKSEWDDESVDYTISVQDSRYDHNNHTLLGRIKGALKILFGKPVLYNDIYINDSERFTDFVRKLQNL
jgi:hypothetical protein